MNFCRTEVYVGTPLMRRLEREGRLVGDVFGWDYAIADPRADPVPSPDLRRPDRDKKKKDKDRPPPPPPPPDPVPPPHRPG